MNVEKKTSYVIAGVVAAAAGLLLLYFAVDSQKQATSIITEPGITQQQAIVIV